MFNTLIADIEKIENLDSLNKYLNDSSETDLIVIQDMTIKETENLAEELYKSYAAVAIFDNKIPYKEFYKNSFMSVEFSNLSDSIQNNFKESIDIILFDDLTLDNKIQLINQFNGIKHGYDSSIMDEINKLSDNDKKELLPSSEVGIVDSGNNIFNQVLVVDDFYNLYNYIGEQQSYSFDLSDLFQLKTDPIDKDGQ